MSFLRISESYTNREWVGPSDQSLQKALLFSKTLSISQLSAYQLIKNKIDEKDYGEYISPKIKNFGSIGFYIPCCYLMKNYEAVFLIGLILICICKIIWQRILL